MANEFKIKKGLIVNGSGSIVLDIQGSQGQLFSVTDQLTGTLFSVSDISGIPILEVDSDDTIRMGTFGSEAIIVSGSHATVSGSFSGSFQGDGQSQWDNVTGGINYASGNVGIGTTSPAARLEVKGGTTLSAVAFSGPTVKIGDYTGAGSTRIFSEGTNIGYSTSNGYHDFTNAGSSQVRITSAGNVGIGTTSPGTNLEIRKSASDNIGPVLRLRADDSNDGNPEIQLYRGNGSAVGSRIYLQNGNTDLHIDNLYDGSSTYGRIFFRTQTIGTPINAMTIMPGGNVGIGTTSPNAKLDVIGDGTVSGNLTFKPKAYSSTDDLNNDNRSIFSTHQVSNTTSNRATVYSSVYTLGGGVSNALQISTNEDYNESGMFIRQYNQNGASPQGTGWQNWTEVWTTNHAPLSKITNWDTAYTYSQVGHLPLTGGTLTGNLTITGGSDIFLADNGKTHYGASNDLEVFHNGSDSYIIEKGTGDLRLQTTNGTAIKLQSGTEDMVVALANSSISLYHDSIKKLETATTGVTITGTATATTFNATLLQGELEGTISSATTGTTQANATNDTTVATTAFVQNLIGTIPAGLVFQGTWNAATNTPTLANGTGTTGHFYIVSTEGSTNLDGITDWKVGDWAVFVEQGATDAWEKVDNSSVLDGSGTGQTVALWGGSGTSNTLTDAPITVSGNNTTFAGGLTGTSGFFSENVNIQGTGNLTIRNTTSTGSGIVFIDTTWQAGIEHQSGKLFFRTGGQTDRMVIDDSGDVGIGTTSPSQKLEVMGGVVVNSGFNTGIASLYLSHTNPASPQHKAGIFTTYVSGYGRSSSMQFALNDQMTGDIVTTADAKMTLLENGNVGIGTTSPTAGLQVAKGGITIPVAGSSTASAVFGNSTSDDNYGVAIGANSSGVGYISSQRTDGTATTYNLAIQPNGGNVGIGTTSPSAPLSLGKSVYGDFDSENFYRIKLQDQGGTHNDVGIGQTASGNMGFNITAGSAFIFNNGTSGEIARFNGTGLGIGTTSPGEKLDVNGRIRGDRFRTNVSGDATFAAYYFLGDADTGTFQPSNNTFAITTAGTERMRINSVGNVSIGTTSAEARLHVAHNDGGVAAKFVHSGPGTGYAPGSILLQAGQSTSRGQGIYHYNTEADENWFTGVPYNVTSRKWIVANKPSTTFDLDTAQLSHALMTIDSDNDGNVGIGTTSPTYKLDVNGTSRFANTVTFGARNFRVSPNEFYGSITVPQTLNSTDNTAYINIGTFSDGFTHIVIEVELIPWLLNTSNIGSYSKTYTVRMTSANPGVVNSSSANVTRDLGAVGDLYQLATPIANSSNLLQIPIKYIPATGAGNQVAVNIRVKSYLANNIDKVALSQVTPTAVSAGVQEYVSFRTNVGIGTTSPSEKLEVAGNVKLNSGALIISGTPASQGAQTRYISGAATTNDLWFNVPTNGRYRFAVADSQAVEITSSGNVGIGTTSPTAKLHIEDATNPRLLVKDSNGAGIYTQAYNGYGILSTLGSTSYLTFGINDHEKVRLTNDGKLGIGTTSPSYKLQVAGGINAGGKATYSKAAGSLDTTGYAVAGLTTASNGQSAGFTFTCFGHTGKYQKIVYSCWNAAGTWNTSKVIDEGTNDFDIEASANGTTITFTFKSRSGSKSYTPRVTVEATGTAINNTYA